MAEQAQDEIRRSSSTIPLAYKVFEPQTDADPGLCPLVFLHGLTSCKETWTNIPQLLADATRRKAYIYDARNHGDSDWSDEFTVDDLVLDLMSFLEYNHIPKAVLIGHSLGGTVSIHFVLQYPEKVEMVIIEEMFIRLPPPSFYAVPLTYTTLAPVAVEQVPIDADEETATKLIMDYIFQNLPPQCVEDQQMHNRVDKSTMALKRGEDGRFSLKANMAVIEKSLRLAIEKPRPLELQCTYDGPACFIYGELSHFQVGKDRDDILKYFPQAEFAEIENSRHTIHSDNPEVCVNTILKFISRNGIVQENQ